MSQQGYVLYKLLSVCTADLRGPQFSSFIHEIPVNFALRLLTYLNSFYTINNPFVA